MRKKNSTLLSFILGAVLLCGCAGLDRNVYHGETVTADGVSAARHTFNVWFAEEMVQAKASNNVARMAQLSQSRDHVHKMVYDAGFTLKTVDQLRLQVRSDPSTTNRMALSIALQSLPQVSSNIAYTVKYLMTGGLLEKSP